MPHLPFHIRTIIALTLFTCAAMTLADAPAIAQDAAQPDPANQPEAGQLRLKSTLAECNLRVRQHELEIARGHITLAEYSVRRAQIEMTAKREMLNVIEQRVERLNAMVEAATISPVDLQEAQRELIEARAGIEIAELTIAKRKQEVQIAQSLAAKTEAELEAARVNHESIKSHLRSIPQQDAAIRVREDGAAVADQQTLQNTVAGSHDISDATSVDLLTFHLVLQQLLVQL